MTTSGMDKSLTSDQQFSQHRSRHHRRHHSRKASSRSRSGDSSMSSRSSSDGRSMAESDAGEDREEEGDENDEDEDEEDNDEENSTKMVEEQDEDNSNISGELENGTDPKQHPAMIGNVYESLMLANSAKKQPIPAHLPFQAANQFFNFQNLSEQQFKLLSQFYSDFRAAASAATASNQGPAVFEPKSDDLSRLNEELIHNNSFHIFNQKNF